MNSLGRMLTNSSRAVPRAQTASICIIEVKLRLHPLAHQSAQRAAKSTVAGFVFHDGGDCLCMHTSLAEAWTASARGLQRGPDCVTFSWLCGTVENVTLKFQWMRCHC